jgi:hypothetical protein
MWKRYLQMGTREKAEACTSAVHKRPLWTSGSTSDLGSSVLLLGDAIQERYYVSFSAENANVREDVLSQRPKHKFALKHSRMRNEQVSCEVLQPGPLTRRSCVEYEVIVSECIQINRSRPVADRRHTSDYKFDVLQKLEQLHRRHVRFHLARRLEHHSPTRWRATDTKQAPFMKSG